MPSLEAEKVLFLTQISHSTAIGLLNKGPGLSLFGSQSRLCTVVRIQRGWGLERNLTFLS